MMLPPLINPALRPHTWAERADRQRGVVAGGGLQAERGEIREARVGDRNELDLAARPPIQHEAVGGVVMVVGIGIANLPMLQPPLAGIGAALFPVRGAA